MSDLLSESYDNEPLNSQVERLANYILSHFDDEPSGPHGAIDTAILLLDKYVHSGMKLAVSLTTKDSYYIKQPKRPTPAEMILLLNIILLFNGYILTTWKWEDLDWGVYDGKNYIRPNGKKG